MSLISLLNLSDLGEAGVNSPPAPMARQAVVSGRAVLAPLTPPLVLSYSPVGACPHRGDSDGVADPDPAAGPEPPPPDGGVGPGLRLWGGRRLPPQHHPALPRARPPTRPIHGGCCALWLSINQ